MTIIEPKKNKLKFNYTGILLIGLVLFGVMLTISVHNRNVSVAHDLGEALRRLDSLRVANVGLKNQMYALLDFENADKLAAQLGLIKEKSPDYLTINR